MLNKRQPRWGANVKPDERRDQSKLIYDYIKFHIGLYLATPTVVIIVGDALSLKTSCRFWVGLLMMIAIYAFAGAHAGFLVGRLVNDPWQDDYLVKIEKYAFRPRRRFIHHTLYWIGIVIVVTGIIVGLIDKHFQLGLCSKIFDLCCGFSI